MTPDVSTQFDPSMMGIGSIGQLLLSAVSRYPDHPAVADDHHAWTYTQFADVVARAICALKGIGLRKGDGFAMLLSNRAEQLACQYAAALIGARYTALHPLASHETHLFVLKDADIKMLLTEPDFLDARLGTSFHDGTFAVQHVLSLGPAVGAVDLLALISSATPAPLVDEADPEDIAFLYYTGGTTGVPKGVMLPHRSIVTAALVQAVEWDLPAGAIRYLAATPTSHASGVIVPTVFIKGGLVRVTAGFEPKRFCRLVERERINFTFLVPTMVYVLLDHAALQSCDLSSLETVVYGAAPMSADRLSAAIERFGSIFVQLYGQTEAPMVITALRKADHDPSRPERLSSCGLPCSSVQVKLFDPQMREVGVGEAGEICVRGPLVMAGYWKRTEETREAFRGGWLHTGDVAKRSADGFLTIVDRTKDMMISGGFNVYPREVEDALMAHSEVSMAAVIGMPDPKWGEAVTAFVVRRKGATIDELSLKAHVRKLRGPICVPKIIHFVTEVPVTPLGKVDRKAMRARHSGPQAS